MNSFLHFGSTQNSKIWRKSFEKVNVFFLYAFLFLLLFFFLSCTFSLFLFSSFFLVWSIIIFSSYFLYSFNCFNFLSPFFYFPLSFCSIVQFFIFFSSPFLLFYCSIFHFLFFSFPLVRLFNFSFSFLLLSSCSIVLFSCYPTILSSILKGQQQEIFVINGDCGGLD